jgi:hypothetical protein
LNDESDIAGASATPNGKIKERLFFPLDKSTILGKTTCKPYGGNMSVKNA